MVPKMSLFTERLANAELAHMNSEWWQKLKQRSKAVLPDPVTALKLILFSPEDVEAQILSHPDYENAIKFKDTIDPKDGIDYEWVLEYAKYQFDRADRLYKELDDKANDIIKYLGGGTGLFTLAAIFNTTPQRLSVILASIPAFLLALVAVALAARARQPNPAREPPSIKGAYGFAEHFKNAKLAQAGFIGQWHATCEGMHLAIKAKGERVQHATRFYVWAIVSLAIPIVVAIVKG